MAGGTRGEREAGQASISLIAVVPGLIVAALAAIQFALAGHAALSAANAARAAARASYTGADPTAAARAALPGDLAPGARVEALDDRVEVKVEAQRALPFLPPVSLTAAAGLGPPGGVPDG
jgi:Flp pilus assembly protein TadG